MSIDMQGSELYDTLYYYVDNTLDKNELNQGEENFNLTKKETRSGKNTE